MPLCEGPATGCYHRKAPSLLVATTEKLLPCQVLPLPQGYRFMLAVADARLEAYAGADGWEVRLEIHSSDITWQDKCHSEEVGGRASLC